MSGPKLIVDNSLKRKMRRSLSVDELLALPPPAWAIRGRLPASGLVILHGEPAAGKTFLMFDWAMSLARGEDWHGHKTRQIGVLYVAGEGVTGLGVRMRAYTRSRGVRPGTQFRVVPQAIDFPNSVSDLFDEIACIEKETGWAAGVVVLDTLARTAGGLDENSSQMSVYIEAADKLIAAGKLVVVLHHPGKDSARGMRGWSGMRGAVDVEIELTVGADGVRAVTWKKQKDAEVPPPVGFRLRQIETGEVDEDGQAVTSCVVEPCDAPAAASRGRPTGDKQQLLHGLVGELLKVSRDFGKAGQPAGRPCVLLDQLAERWRAAVPGEAGEKNKLLRTLKMLTQKGLVAGDGEWVWTP
ncbi:MAG: helicase RepA family protein [Burkholderiales bacterium]|nr:helicase RepA family protein [Burkholderiales bacterium]